MVNLLKADFFRILKTKLVYISLIIAVLLPLLLSGMLAGLMALLGSDDPELGTMLTDSLNCEYLIKTTFSTSQNFGIAVPVFTVIIVMADISSGTVRNKIIYGYKRHEIYASHFITSFTYCLILMIVYSLMTAVWGVIILGGFDIDASVLMHYVYFYTLGLLGLATLVSLACCLCLSLLNTAGSIIITVVITIFVGFIISLLPMLEAYGVKDFVVHILRFLPNYVISAYQEIKPMMFLEGLGGIALFSGGLYALGSFIFSKRDFK